jgi:gliding motility-associated-like protein
VTGLPNNYVIADVLHNPTDSPQTVTYTIVPISPTGCAAGPSQTVVITVNPIPQVVSSTLTQTICNDGATNVTLTSPSTFNNGPITFNYTVVATGGVTGFTTPVTGLPNNHVIADVLHNPTDSPQTVTYTIVPISPTGCAAGPGKIVVITVNPTPQVVSSTLTQTICNDGATNVTLTSPSTFNNGPITFNYTVVATGGVTGFTTPVTGLPNNHVIADVLHNPTDSPQTVTYTIVPISPTGCAAGPSKTVVITVNPTPQVVPSTLMQTICNDGTTSVVLTSPSTFTSGVITFNYTVVATGGVTGFTTPVTGLPNNFVISDVLHNPTDTSQTVTYTIVPISPTGCAAGPSKTVVITVDPTPQVVPSTMSQTICNDGTTNVILSSPSTFTHGVITFNYTVVAMGGVTGFTTPVTGLPNNYVIADVLHNPTDAPQTVTYKIVPISPMGCTSDPIKIVNIIVNPTPRIFPVPSNSTQCDSLTTNIRLQSPSIFTSGLITFKYTVTTTGSISGYSSPVSGLSNNQVIGDKLINNTDHFQIVTYQVVPVSPLGCSDGTARGVTVTVNPTPRVIPINLDPSICYTGTLLAPVNTQVVLTSPTVMTTGSMRFDYTVNVSGEPGVVVGNTSPAFNQTPGYTINYQYQNNSDTVQSVYYSIIPKVDNAICVHGRSVVSEVKIHARPLQSIVVTKPLTCSGGAGLAALKAVISKGANPYQIVWDGPVGYHKVDSLAIANLSSGKYVVKVTDNLGCNRKDSISIVPVTARAYISADVIPPGNYNISCIGSTDGRILVSVTGGITPPYKYWVIKNPDTFADTLYSGLFTNNLILSDPTTYRYYNNLGAGTYALVIQDVNGCININKIAFRVPPPIVSSFSKSQHAGYNISCKGYNDGWVSVVTSGGRGTGFTYSWYTFNGNIPGPVNTNRIDIITAGTYFLVTKDVLGCTKLDSTIISEPDGLQLAGYQLSKSADGNFNISCNGGNDGSIAMTISGGSGNNSYSWTGPAGFTSSAKDISGLKAGVYTCIVTDQNNCVLTPSPSFTLTEPTPLVLSTPLTSVSTDGAYNVNCHGANSGWIRITVTGGSIGTYKYNWITTDGSGIINGQKDQLILTAGTYHLIVTDSNNCVITKDIVLTQPPALVTHLTATNITCKSPGFDNGSITLTVSGGITPYTFLWSNGDTSKDLTGLTPGIYTVTATDLNGCIIKDSARIDLPPSLKYTKNLSDYNGFNISCNGLADGFINVDPTTGSAPFVYTWTGPNGYAASTNNISNLISGEYQLLIVDSNECKASETFDLTEPGKLGFTYSLSSSTAGGYNINCAGDLTGSIDIQPVNQVKTVNYLWADGIFGQTRTDLPAGNYSLIITDANNCHASATIAITQPDSLKLIFSVVPPFCPDKPDGSIGTEVTGGVRGAGYLYRWSDNSSNSNLLNIPEGYYKVTVTDMNGCLVKDSVNVKPINETCLIIPNAISPNGDLINDVWNIGMKELYPKMEVIIFNRWGETIWRSERGYPRPWDGTSNGSPLPIDSYHYIIDLHNGSRPFVGNVTIVR